MLHLLNWKCIPWPWHCYRKYIVRNHRAFWTDKKCCSNKSTFRCTNNKDFESWTSKAATKYKKYFCIKVIFFILILIRSISQFSLVSISERKNRKSNDGLLRRFNDAKSRAYKANEPWALASTAVCPLFVFRALVFQTWFSTTDCQVSVVVAVSSKVAKC